ncbi:hypothetical protein GCM10020220_072120 [Nonomuraea rubra]
MFIVFNAAPMSRLCGGPPGVIKWGRFVIFGCRPAGRVASRGKRQVRGQIGTVDDRPTGDTAGGTASPPGAYRSFHRAGIDDLPPREPRRAPHPGGGPAASR